MDTPPGEAIFVTIFKFFSSLGSGWVSGSHSGELPTQISTNVLGFQDQAPLVVRILSEVKTGWSLQTILDFWGPLLQIPVIVTLVFGTSMIYCAIRVYQIRQYENIALQTPEPVLDSHEASRIELRWRRVLESSGSDDPQSWRNAILEADQMLNELLDTLGYKGETMDEKIRRADPAAFQTLDFAWEAHQVRNRVMQDPEFVLDAREARRVVKMYERVFEEFHFLRHE